MKLCFSGIPVIMIEEYWAPDDQEGRKTKGIRRINGWIKYITEAKNNNKIDKVKLFGG